MKPSMSQTSTKSTGVDTQEIVKKLSMVSTLLSLQKKKSTQLVSDHHVPRKPNAVSTRDSGYSSQSSSQASSPQRAESNTPIAPKAIDKAIPDRLLERYIDFKKLYTQAIWGVVSKRARNTEDILMKLKYIGTDETDARLCVVIQCDRRIMKKVKKFFERTDVKESLGDDLGLHFIGEGFTRLSGTDIADVNLVQLSRSGPLPVAGALIHLVLGDKTKPATLGGLIRVYTTNSQSTYGITSGHSLSTLIPKDISDVEYSSDEDSEMDSIENPSLGDRDQKVLDQDVFLHPDTGDVENGIKIGTIVATSFQQTGQLAGNNHDWAVVKLGDGDNVLNDPDSLRKMLHGERSRKDWQYAGDDDDEQGHSLKSNLFPAGPESRLSGQPVFVHTCHGHQYGTVSSNHSALAIGPCENFVETLEYRPEGLSQLKPGDSGSWVIHQTSGEVYGHIVGIDAFGEAQIMPIWTILDDIKRTLGAYKVALVSKSDLDRIQPTGSPRRKEPLASPPNSTFMFSPADKEAPENPSTAVLDVPDLGNEASKNENPSIEETGTAVTNGPDVKRKFFRRLAARSMAQFAKRETRNMEPIRRFQRTVLAHFSKRHKDRDDNTQTAPSDTVPSPPEQSRFETNLNYHTAPQPSVGTHSPGSYKTADYDSGYNSQNHSPSASAASSPGTGVYYATGGY